MHFAQDGRFVRTDIWREGKWLDLWSVVHYLSGTSVGLGFYFLRFDALAATALAFVCFVAYEMWEKLMDIFETPQNRFMDVVVGMVSFLPAFFLIAPHVSRLGLVQTFFVVFVANIVLAVLGWRASQKAAALEERLRAELAMQREKLVRHGKRLRRKFGPKGARPPAGR
jgi:hypothetical protein